MKKSKHTKNKSNTKENTEPRELEPNARHASEIYVLKDVWKLLTSNISFILLLWLGTFVAYINLLGGEFLTADDIPGIVQNPLTKDLAASIATYRIQPVYFALIHSLFGMNSTAFHWGSLLMHFFIIIEVFVLTYIVFGKKISTIATILFAIHPVNSEAVGWIAGNGYLHFAVFSYATLIFYALFKKSNNKRYLYVSAAIYSIGLFALRNPWTLVTPFLIFIMDQLFFENRIKFKNIINYLPFVPFTIFFVYKWLVLDRATVSQTLVQDYYFDPNESAPLLNRIPYTIYMVFKLYLIPQELTIYHEGKIISYALYTFMIISTLAIGIATLVLLKKNRPVAGLILSIVSTILPTMSPTVIAWFVAERYMYQGSIFFTVMLTMAILAIAKKYNNDKIATYAVIIIAAAYLLRTFIRTQDYKTNKAFWLSTQREAPLSYRVYNNLGDVYAREGNFPLAIDYFKKSVEINPKFADAVHNIGYTYMEAGDYDNAKKYLEESFAINPRLVQALFKLGVLEYRRGNFAGARSYFEKCLQVNPQYSEALNAINTMNSAGL